MTGNPAFSDRSQVLAARRAGETGMVHSWELVTAVDGPGTRMTIFLSGCPLRCQYCQNPDTWQMRDGTATSVEEVLARIRRYSPVFAATGGGVTISGGEPLMQPRFVEEIFRGCRAAGIHTALDTSGFLGSRASDALLEHTSLVLLDVKSGLPGTYREVTTRELAPTIVFGDRLSARGTPMWVRFVLVPGLTDSVENVEAVADIVERWPTVERVEILPFHQLGESKWVGRKLPYTLHGVRPPDGALQERVREQFRRRGLVVY
ncbi:pyruvate formate-lyase-activating protein [Pseudolysinimonas yzui]|uniref:Pyruvate formate-lyase-activating enzyme n=1 Tax=Pseudolysinimonas yzui TaxID=2708254 RepID=A0A8J3GPR5_9MICO|nr:pyruvate formate-lyase-activating protein [Pseudolysinimonas yzui]GHF12858.1 pyruvate formate-lyase-activating enzyme [Pseudolysinimonas yzui]